MEKRKTDYIILPWNKADPLLIDLTGSTHKEITGKLDSSPAAIIAGLPGWEKLSATDILQKSRYQRYLQGEIYILTENSLINHPGYPRGMITINTPLLPGFVSDYSYKGDFFDGDTILLSPKTAKILYFQHSGYWHLQNLPLKTWKEIKTAHGTAAHIPTALWGLTSSDPGTREKAYWNIDNVVVLQGDLYEAAYYIIEPLIYMLESDTTPDKRLVTEILIEIALGWAPDDHTITINKAPHPLETSCKTLLQSYREDLIRLVQKENPPTQDKIKELIEYISEN